MADISTRLSGLSAKKLKLLAEKLSEAEKDSPNGIRRQARDTDLIPLSFEQERLWLLDQLNPGSPAYNNSIAISTDGAPREVEEIVNELIRRHEILRARFPLVEGQPVQMIAPVLKLTLDVVDLGGLSATEYAAKAAELAGSEAQRPFNLMAGPLIRVKALIRGREDMLLLLTLHHTISDGFSLGALKKEFLYFDSFYRKLRLNHLPRFDSLLETFARGTHPELPELPIQYADYAVWQRKRLQGEVLDSLMAYWKKQLAGLPPLNLPTDHPRAADGGKPGGRQSVTLSSELAIALNQLSQREGVTLFMTLLAAFKVLLYRYSGQEDIALGTPVAGRGRKELESLAGFFVNMLVLRTSIGGNQSFRDILSRVKDVCLGAYEHQEMPFAKLVTDLNPERNLGKHPLFQVGFQLNNTPVSFKMQTTEDVLLSRYTWLDTGSAIFDLHLTIDRMTSQGKLGEGGFRCVLEYDAGLFEAQTAGRMIRNFKRLLERIVEDADQRIDEIDILTGEEKHQLLVEWNKTESEYAKDKRIHELFEERAETAPDSVAVVCGHERITYGELNRRANLLAHYLRARGVGPEVVVGVCIDRSVEMVVGLLGILKAGGAYLPIEPEYPAERIAHILEDAQAPALLAKESLTKLLPYQPQTVIYLDREEREIEESNPDDPRVEMTGRNLAYVIYTSGSTAKPKGVLIEHAQVVRLFEATQQWYGFGPQDVWTMLHSYAFDFSVWEIWGALLYGGKVIVAPNEVRKDPVAVYELLAREGVTILNQTPLAFRQLCAVDESVGVSDRLSLRTVIFGGEALEFASLRGWFERRGEEKPILINMYGITETTVHVTYRPIRAEEARTETKSVIGRRIPDLQMYVLDGMWRLAPLGVNGEIYVGGAGLARGYLHKPELTAERFIPNAYSDAHGARLYKTGDLGRYRVNGEMEFLGRADHQVKIRGYRIEPGEIEAALASHQAVREAVVTARDDFAGGKRLLAYVSCKPGNRSSVAEAREEVTPPEHDASGLTTQLRRHLRTKLPEYMVPSTFVYIDALPLDPNGKVDRRALPEAGSSRPDLEDVFANPCNRIEQTLAVLWAEALRLDRVGVHDNFFELGGDSILAIQIVSRANQAGLLLTPRQIFQNQTIAELAAVAGIARDAEAERSSVERSAPLTPVQHWFFEQDLANAHYFNQARMFEVTQEIETESLKRVVEEIVNLHDALRLRFYRREGKWEQSDSGREDGEIFQEIDLSGTAGDDLPRAIEEAATRIQSSLNLSEGPLIKVALINLGRENGKRLLVVIHHLAVDGVSWRILLEDLQRGYEQARLGEINLGGKTTSYKRWAESLKKFSQGEALKAEANYWIRHRLEAPPMVPRDYELGENTVGSARHVMTWINEEGTSRLLQDAPAAYGTQINDLLLTALALAYREWTGSGRVLIDLEGHGREEIIEGLNITRTVGWFTTIYPVALELGEVDGVGEAIKLVKERLRGIPNKGIGYGLLKYLSGEEEIRRDLRDAPEIVFNYLGQLGRPVGRGRLFRPAKESAGPTRSSKQKRRHALEINGASLGGRLQMRWTYSENLHRRETIEALAESYNSWLKTIIEHCASSGASGYTPADFPLAGLGQEQLDDLIGEDRNVEDIYKLSPAQEGLLFHSLYRPEAGEYIVQVSVTLADEVHREEFERVWQEVARKNEALRTEFRWEWSDEPVQIVRKSVKTPVEYKDWTGKDSREQQKELKSYLNEDRKLGFDLRKAPLMRVCLIRKGEKLYQWIWSFHHILMDGWSLPLVLSQLSGMADSVASAPPYRNYIEWLRKQDLGKAEHYWRESLKGFTEPTRLGIEKPGEHMAAQGGRYQEVSTRLSEEVIERLEAMAREKRLTLNTLAQGAWALLLSRYSGEKDVVYGITVSGRPAELAGIERVVGMFINTLPVRSQFRAEERAIDWLRRLQDQQAEMREYEYSPLARIQEWSEIMRGEMLFESIFAFENYPMLRSLRKRAEGSKLRDLRSIERTNYPLSVVVVPGDDLRINIIYDEDRYEEATIRRMLEHYGGVLESFSRNVDRRIAEIDVLTADEKRRLLLEWNGKAADYTENKCAQEMLEEQAERTPDRVALAYEDEQVTYAELNRRANQVGHYLLAKGAGPESIVGICVERSVEMVVGLFGILKAGGAYLPLDPSYPGRRLKYMLDETCAKALVTTGALLEELGGVERRAVLLDSDWARIAEQSEENPPRQADSRNAAYVIYTSGSTGEPKGVVVEHKGIFNMALAQVEGFGVVSESNILQFASLSFDASIFEIIMGQSAGARLCLASKERLLPGPDLLELLGRQSITRLTIPPSVLSLLPEGRLPGLDTIIVAGEACPEGLVERWGHERRFFNAYGPTEATVWSSALECIGKGKPSIGRPIPNVQMYILDDDYNLAPVGVAGEIYIGGVGLARGYYGRADLTAERFMPNAYGGEAGARLYRTGDLGRRREGGEIEFISRRDGQVKVRGYRVEPGEIEAALREFTAVAECVVVAREWEDGEKRLVGYVTTGGPEELSASELKGFLREKLPEHMIPAAFVRLDKLPLTENGKIDRRALPEPRDHAIKTGEAYAPPRNEAEAIIAAIWRETLKVDKVSINDNFFDMGGNSLLMIKAHNRLQKALNTNAPIIEMFRRPTVKSMAAYLSDAQNQDSSSERGQSRAITRKKLARRHR
jgi:amino acid adenylation domain-containing protein/non-ribosomal peptide synthase protein (TIGR01720 family)